MNPETNQSASVLWPIPVPARAVGGEEAGDAVTGWLAGIRDGEEAAFNAFYACYAGRLYRYLFAILPADEALVRDAFQEAMLRVVRYAKPMASEADAWRWLTRVGRSALYDLLRKRRRRRAREANAPAALEPDDAEARVDAALHRVLAELSAGDRDLLEAFYFQRVDQETLAGRGGTTRKAIESRLARLRARVRERVIEVLSDED
jgi:RNA polymerase sigma-70 factor, ECF subfamily